MSKWKVSNKIMTSCRCIDCNRPLKQNLINKKTLANRDYICYNLYIGKDKLEYTKTNKKNETYRKVINLRERQIEQIKTYKHDK